MKTNGHCECNDHGDDIHDDLDGDLGGGRHGDQDDDLHDDLHDDPDDDDLPQILQFLGRLAVRPPTLLQLHRH
jgi:hypothetical protein